MTGLIVDNFAGGGGASTGIEAALGCAVDLAINHDEQAIRMHEANHPGTMHVRNNIWQIDPEEVVRDVVARLRETDPARQVEINPATRLPRVDLAWFSPDCKHFSKAKGGKPREKSIRDLAWVVVLWAQRVRPDVILLENVEEFRTWGPLCSEGRPIKERQGETFDKWQRELRKAGYKLQWKELRACDYGAPTIRKRFFMIARCDGKPIVWPEPTHGKPGTPEVESGKRKPWRTAAEIVDWSIPCPSIFERKKPLAENTKRRIAHGIMKFVVNNPSPFIVPLTHHGSAGRSYGMDAPLPTVTGANRGEMAVVSPHITKFRSGAVGHDIGEPLHTVTANSYVKRPGGSAPLGLAAAHLVHVGNGERKGQAPRVMDVEKPLGTVVAGGTKHHAVTALLAQFNTNPNGTVNPGHSAEEPVSTIATRGPHQGVVASNLVRVKECDSIDESTRLDQTLGAMEVRSFLLKYYGTDQDPRLEEPLHSVTTKDRFGLVTVTIEGEEYVIVDIGMRMLTPRELFNAQGFPPEYTIDTDAHGKPITKTAQVAKCGNSVCPPLAEALADANVADAVTEPKEPAAA